MKKMKTLVFSKEFYPSLGGMQRTTDYMALALSDIGHTPVVFTENCEIYNDSMYPYGVVRSKSLILLIKEIHKAEVIILKGGLVIKVGMLCILLGRPFIVYYEGSDSLIKTSKSIKNKIRNFFIKICVAKAIIHLGVSQHALDTKKLNTNHNAKILYNIVHPELEQYGNSSNVPQFDFCYVGNVTTYKGVKYIIDAIKMLNENGVRVSCIFAGDGDALEDVYNAAKKYPIKVMGRCHRKELATVFQSAKCLLQATLQTEGFPLVIAEAFLFGLPVIAPEHTAFPEAVGNAGLFYQPGNVPDLAKKMIDFLHDKTLRKQLSCNAKIRSEQFRFHNYKRELKNIFDDRVINCKRKF